MKLHAHHVRTMGLICFAALFLTLFIASCTPLSTAPVVSQPGTTTTVIIVRHAERDGGPDPDEALNEEGLARAAALAEVLKGNGVTAIYCPEYTRNRQTCEAVAEPLGLSINFVQTDRLADTKALANALVDEFLELHAGGVVLWVGNTGPAIEGVQEGNLQELYARLGGTGRPPILYRDLYIVVIPEEGKGEPHFIEAMYGGFSSKD